MPAELGRVSLEQDKSILDPGLSCLVEPFFGLDQTSGGVDFSFLGHHSIYSKPWQWYMTQAVCKPYDLKMIFFFFNH